jgi:hypothetical protein
MLQSPLYPEGTTPIEVCCPLLFLIVVLQHSKLAKQLDLGLGSKLYKDANSNLC